jgi:argininosuccinate lyase
MAKVWDKGNAGKLDPVIESYTVGNDYKIDGRFLKYELDSSLAHAMMLNKIGVLSANELSQIETEIRAIRDKYGEYVGLDVSDEDIHSWLETRLIEKIGDTGKKLHTGRSRNDQILTVIRLFEKDSLTGIINLYKSFLLKLAGLGKRDGEIPIPGYTHTKQAMLLTVKMWVAGFIEAGLDNIEFIKSIIKLVDSNPLGTGSGFGVPLPLDRKLTAELMGFSRVLESPVYAQNSRGKIEGLVIDSLWCIMNDFSRMASDLLLFNMDELGYVKASDAITTGSSIMPQKRNLDVLELVRARTNVMLSYSNIVKNIASGIISGYNRDMQETKEPLVNAFNLAESTIRAMDTVIDNIRFEEGAVKRSLDKGIFATDIAFKKVGEGMPFREAYKFAASSIEQIEINDKTIRESIDGRMSQGSHPTIDLDAIEKRIRENL